MTLITQKTLPIIALPILMATLTMSGMELSPKHSGTFRFNPNYQGSGYAGRTERKTAKAAMNIEIAACTECVSLQGEITPPPLSIEEFEAVYQYIAQNNPDLIEELNEQGITLYNHIADFLKKPALPFEFITPVTMIKNLEYNDTFELNGQKMLFHDTPEKLRQLRKASKYSPIVFAAHNEDIRELLDQKIITIIDPLNTTFGHGQRGSGPKQKTIKMTADK